MEKDFLKEIKEGEEILIVGDKYYLDKVLRITPTRQIKTIGGKVFKNGFCEARGMFYQNYHILEKTEKNMKKYIMQENKNELKTLLANVKVNILSLENIEKLINVLKEVG